MTIKPLSFDKLKTVPLEERAIEADGDDFGSPYHAGDSFSDFLYSLPGLGVSASLLRARDAIVSSHRAGHHLILGCGASIMTKGLNPAIVSLLENRLVTGLVLTGEACVKDVEIALSGSTVDCSEEDLRDGLCYCTEDTGRLINEALAFGAVEGWGMGQAVGNKILDEECPNLDHSILATACNYGIPATVHPAIGADAFNLHPMSHGESLGACGVNDFRLLAAIMADADHGVVINTVSSLIPRLILKAADAARNLGHPIAKLDFITIESSARALVDRNLIQHLVQPNGELILLPGPPEILLAMLFASVLDTLGNDS